MRTRLVAVWLAGALTLCGSGGWSGAGGVAQAAPPAPGNCIAVLTSFFGPRGEVDDAVHILQPLAAQQGMTLGQLAAMLAREQGTVNQCLAVLGLPPVQP
jgi:hypothetical protein